MLDKIARCQLFRYLRKDDLAVLLDIGTVRQAPRGKRVFEEGEPGESMYAILSGGLSIQLKSKDGTLKTLALLGPGDCVGEMSVVDRQPRSATAVTVDETSFFELTRQGLVHLMKDKPDVASRLLWALVETLSARLRQSEANYQAMAAREKPAGA